MTTIAWDGKLLVADKQANINQCKFKVNKIIKHNGELLFAAGSFDLIKFLYDWYCSGAVAEKFPSFQSGENWNCFHVIKKNGEIWRYERTHIPFLIDAQIYACGSGRDFALTAMELGRSAKEAVAIAHKFDPDTGNEFDILTLD